MRLPLRQDAPGSPRRPAGRGARSACRRAGAALLALALAGCVSIQEFRALEREVADLKGGGRVAGGGDARLAEMGARLDALERELAAMRGEIEEARHTAQRALEEAQASSSRAPAPTTTPGDEAAAPDERASDMPSSSAEVRDYEEAFRVYRLGEYQTAIDRFRVFLQNYPSSDYADNALFWMGECYAKLGDSERAVLTFQDVVKQYPNGNKVPDALYRQGIALIDLGRKTGQEETYNPAAREIFDRIVREFPHSERVPEAKRQLQKLGS